LFLTVTLLESHRQLKVGWELAHIFPCRGSSTNAISSKTNKDTAYDAPADGVLATHLIQELFLKYNDCTLFLVNGIFNHLGKDSYIILTLVIIFIASYFLSAITKIVLF